MKEWTCDLQRSFEAASNPGEAAAMTAYMRGQFDFWGIKSPVRSAIVKEWLSRIQSPSADQLEQTARALWELPQREYQYAALDLLAKHVKRLEERHLDLLESLVVHKSWWDTVDALASNLIGPLLLRHAHLTGPLTERWIECDHMWLQRTALLYQLKYKKNTDTDRLFRYIGLTKNSPEFFIRKAIGWALREYSKTDADAVRRFVANHALSPLSEREALKWLERRQTGDSDPA
ncbi:DNA alkylation repair protein [Paenibacillus oceani]|jgi:3-methyladenine DNA glycosylase AlkD|uniref:DNA alkylation repair protein n=1 Tax=Paenibacillus oceani TaxID=2772510 RepID=A0A927CF78_9BACL|nr:DNA alkylation repair protein [Paenibacillus oceani]MBD2864866.1 DNA alkylation repair protein [Paenibacillus oceani]MDF2659822.1 alkylation repair protein [Paenibacillus sp.]